MTDTHCKIGRVRLKGNRSVAKRLPLKLIRTSQQLADEIAARALTTPLTDKQREQGRGGNA